jgi:FkbM family methyltransferase
MICRGKFRSELFPAIFVDMDMGDPIQRLTYWQGNRYEAPLMRRLRDWNADGRGTAFFDIGANYGFVSYYISSLYPKMLVYAFEPNPGNVERLKRTKIGNDLRNFTVVGQGLSNSSGSAEFFVSAIDSGYSTFGGTVADKGPGTTAIRVLLTTFDAWRKAAGLQLPDSPTWIGKMDIEGYEVRALLGMEETLRRHAFKGLCVEVNPRTLGACGNKPKDIFDLMKDYGYDAHDADGILTQPMQDGLQNVYFVRGG